MELTYHDIMNADLSALTTAAGEWRQMGKDCGTVKTNYRDHVRTKLTGWTGEASAAFWVSSRTTLYELGAAKAQALKIADLLDDAHERLVEARKHLKSVRDAAIEEGGMKVDEYGKCTTDTSKLLTKDVEDAVSNPLRMQAEAKWTRRIQKAVQHVDDTDYENMLALKAAAKDTDGKGDKNGFNGKAVGDVEKYAAQRAAHLATKLNAGEDGGGVTGKERHELQVHMRSNANDPEFSRPFLKSIGGAEGTVKLANALTMLKAEEGGAADTQYRSMEKSLATNLASATAVPRFRGEDGKKLALGSEAYGKKYAKWLNGPGGDFYQDWRREMQRVGAKEETFRNQPFGTASTPETRIHGYQSLVTLMKQGDGYSAQMLHDLGDDIRAAEKKDPDIWDNSGDFPARRDFVGDPYDGVLGVMSKDSETSATYLDPATDSYENSGTATEGNDRLKYLIQDRDWKLIDNLEAPAAKDDTVAKDAHEGLQEALRSGATGRSADEYSPTTPPTHSTANAAVMEETVKLFGDPDGYPEIRAGGNFADMRPTLGEMAADYPGEIQRLQFGDEELPVNGKPAKFDAGHMLNFLEGVGRDPQAYGAITAGQQAYTAHVVDEVMKNPSDADPLKDQVTHAVGAEARVAGVLSEAKAQGIFEEKLDERQEFNEKAEEKSKWINRALSLGTGQFHPGLGGPVTWVQDEITQNVLDHIQNDRALDIEGKTRFDFEQSRSATIESIQGIAKSIGEAHNLDADEIKSIRDSIGDRVGSNFDTGSSAALKHGTNDDSKN